ncbi:hypothetical protein [Glycocaulis sp.]|uniref:hypothetical protein n=1 Tax=Glycocaulis sp. TaxID=1969725 RepID=UPI003F715961
MIKRVFGDRPPPPLPWWRVEAAGIGVVAALGLPMVIDQFFHAMNVFPPTRALIIEPGDHILAFSYRLLALIFGAFLAARIGPPGVYRTALAIGVIVLLANVLAVISIRPEGPAWHLIAMAIVALPAALLGAWLAYIRQRHRRVV